jgi:hypothetical protein
MRKNANYSIIQNTDFISSRKLGDNKLVLFRQNGIVQEELVLSIIIQGPAKS